MKKADDQIKKSIPEQEWTKYNRESGNKTKKFVGGLLVIIIVLSVVILWLVL